MDGEWPVMASDGDYGASPTTTTNDQWMWSTPVVIWQRMIAQNGASGACDESWFLMDDCTPNITSLDCGTKGRESPAITNTKEICQSEPLGLGGDGIG